MKRLTIIVPMVAACASSGSAPSTAAAPAIPAEGSYEYLVALPTTQVRGRLEILPDTAIVIPQSDYCRPLAAGASLHVTYTCQGTGPFETLTLRIDRRNPLQLSKWSASFKVQKRRDVCRRYEVRSGRQVCAEMATETYEATESRSGNLQVRRPPP